jgi:hypothetical protein
MTREFERALGKASAVGPAPVTARPAPGKTTLVQLQAAAERAGAGAASPEAAHDIAARGTTGAGSALPHLDRIQAAFGRHDVRGIAAHTGSEAAHASRALGADAYASGGSVAFGTASPSLHTAAHEATHVVQQRAGVQLKGGVGEAGDRYEQHADAVADAVVAGGSAEGLLDQMTGGVGPSSGSAAVQREEPKTPAPGAGDPTAAPADPDQDILDKGDKAIADGKTKFHWYPEQSTDGRARAFIFDDPDADKLLDHLINKWDGSPEARLEVSSANSGVPLWVSKFRERALSVRTTPVGKTVKTALPVASEKQVRQATAAGKLADAVAPKTAAEQFREDLVHQADKTIGKVIKTSAELAEIRHPTDPAKKAMPGYTSCIDTASNELGATKVDKGAARPKLPGIGTMEVVSSPAFTRFTPGSADRPRVGDFAIYAKDKTSGPAFQHIDVIRRIEPAGADGLETWYTIDGGQESTASDTQVPTAERTGKFDPATGAYGTRALYGWVDVEKLYNEAQKAKKP